MKKRPLFLKIIAIANALVVTTAFIGCPFRQDPAIVPATIAPPPIQTPIAPPPPPPFVTIAPYGGNFQQILPIEPPPPPPKQDTRNDNRGP
jgi:hypothetical protein